MVADALDDGARARVAHREALAGQAAREHLALGRAVQDGVADDHVLLGAVRRAVGRHDRQRPAGQALAGVVVGVAVQGELDARRQPAAERLPRRAAELDLDRARRQPLGAALAGDVAGEDAADAAVDVADRVLERDRRAVADRVDGLLDELPVQRVVEHLLLRAHAVQRRALGQVGHREDVRQVDAARLPVLDRLVLHEQVRAADELVDRADAQRRHDLADLLGDEEEEVDDVLGRALEALAQLRVLRGDADRARVQVAGAHHDAARGDQRGRREAHLVGAEHRGDRDVAAGLQLAVGLDDDARAQVVAQQRLLRLGEADLPRHAGRLDRAQRRGAGAAVVAGDEDVVGVGLRDAGGDGADADLGDELDRDVRRRVGAAQVVDELLEVLDRVDVVVRRRRDEAHAGGRVAHAADVLVDLVAGQLAALAGLGALGHLDLQLVGVDEVVDRHAEAAAGDLLDRRAARVAVVVGREADGVLAALAGVRLAAEAVHRDRQRLVRLARDRAERHRAGGEALDDLLGGLDLVERDRLDARRS